MTTHQMDAETLESHFQRRHLQTAKVVQRHHPGIQFHAGIILTLGAREADRHGLSLFDLSNGKAVLLKGISRAIFHPATRLR
jgi:hypothetical protein